MTWISEPENTFQKGQNGSIYYRFIIKSIYADFFHYNSNSYLVWQEQKNMEKIKFTLIQIFSIVG